MRVCSGCREGGEDATAKVGGESRQGGKCGDAVLGGVAEDTGGPKLGGR